MGRPTAYSSEAADEILSRMSDGEQLRLICQSEHLPCEKTIRTWIICPPQDVPAEFLQRYARARNIGLDVQAEGITAIADNQTIDPNSRRIMVDTRRWLFSKMRPDKYGDKLTLDGNLNIGSIAEVLRQREQQLAQVIDVEPVPLAIAAPAEEDATTPAGSD